MSTMLEWIRFALVALCVLGGLCVMLAATFGVFRFRYVLNRMHAAAMGDTLGMLLLFVGLILYAGFSFDALKLILVVALFWLAGPVSSHLIARLETTVNDRLSEVCDDSEIRSGEEE